MHKLGIGHVQLANNLYSFGIITSTDEYRLYDWICGHNIKWQATLAAGIAAMKWYEAIPAEKPNSTAKRMVDEGILDVGCSKTICKSMSILRKRKRSVDACRGEETINICA